MNKHGYIGVRKRTDTNRSKPYYARVSTGCDQFIYSHDFETAEEAAAEFDRIKASALTQAERKVD
jgi:hypothetical protein